MTLRNANSRWTAAQERKLKQLVREKQSLRMIAHELNRTEAAIRSRANKLGLDLSASLAEPEQTPQPLA